VKEFAHRGVSELRFGVSGTRFGVSGPRFGVSRTRFGVSGPRFSVSGPRFGVSGPRFLVLLNKEADKTLSSIHPSSLTCHRTSFIYWDILLTLFLSSGILRLNESGSNLGSLLVHLQGSAQDPITFLAVTWLRVRNSVVLIVLDIYRIIAL